MIVNQNEMYGYRNQSMLIEVDNKIQFINSNY
jgi:hypothetical protein